MSVRAVIDSRGRLFIPSEIRKATGLAEGDTVIVKAINPGELKVVGLRNVIGKGLGMYSHLRKDGKSIVDELIEERRREAEEDSRGYQIERRPAQHYSCTGPLPYTIFLTE